MDDLRDDLAVGNISAYKKLSFGRANSSRSLAFLSITQIEIVYLELDNQFAKFLVI